MLNDIMFEIPDIKGNKKLTVTKDIVLQPKNLDIQQLIIKENDQAIAL
jgi:ATP-dependent protease Clp ATPase subunit